jgi:hypothetical protein
MISINIFTSRLVEDGVHMKKNMKQKIICVLCFVTCLRLDWPPASGRFFFTRKFDNNVCIAIEKGKKDIYFPFFPWFLLFFSFFILFSERAKSSRNKLSGVCIRGQRTVLDSISMPGSEVNSVRHVTVDSEMNYCAACLMVRWIVCSVFDSEVNSVQQAGWSGDYCAEC